MWQTDVSYYGLYSFSSWKAKERRAFHFNSSGNLCINCVCVEIHLKLEIRVDCDLSGVVISYYYSVVKYVRKKRSEHNCYVKSCMIFLLQVLHCSKHPPTHTWIRECKGFFVSLKNIVKPFPQSDHNWA